jgi:hypothetical protein
MEKTKMKAVQMVRQIRDAHHEQLKNKTWEERVAFYREQAQALHRDIESKKQAEENGEETV